MFKKKSLPAKLWLKYTDRQRYREYKWNLANYKLLETTEEFNAGKKINTLQKIKERCKNTNSLSFVHSGNSGDVIYALPTIKRIHELTGAKVNLYLKLDEPMQLYPGATHPLGGVMINKKMADMLMPLLRAQTYVHSCNIYNGVEIDIDLDDFRRVAIPLDRGNIARWCSYITGVTPQLYKSWLNVEPDTSYKDTIVLARSERYRNTFIDHSFLHKYSNLVFLGVESEYKDIKRFIPNVKWVQVQNFMEMASIVAGCKFFIGNQSFPYSIAEGLKVPRVLETCYNVSNVVPEGENAYEFYFQPHFETLIDFLNSNH